MYSETFILLILASIQFTNIMDFMIMMPLGPQLMRLFEINPQQFSILVSAYTLSAGITGFVGAFYIDRFDRKRSLLLTYIGFTLGTFACGLAPTYYFLIAARVFTGIFGGLLGAMVLAIVGDLIPFERRGKAMGLIMSAFSVASVFGVPFGLYMAVKLSWHAPFIFIGILGIIICLLIKKIIPKMNSHIESKENKGNPFSLITGIMADSNQLRGIMLMFLMVLGHFSLVPFISPYMVSNVGFTEQQITYIYLFGGGLTIITSPIVGRLSDKYKKANIFMLMTLLSFIPILAISNMSKVPIAYALFITTLFFVFGNGRMIPAQATIMSTVTPKTRGGFMSITSSVQQLALALAAFIGGSIVVKNEAGLLENYNYIGYMAIILTGVCIFLIRKVKPVDAKPEKAEVVEIV